MYEVVVHDELAEFWAATEAYFTADPVRHTVALTAIASRLANADPDEARSVLVSVRENGEVRGAAMQTPPRPLIGSGIPVDLVEVFVAALLPIAPELSGVNGSRELAEAFGAAWSARTGCEVEEHMAMRLHRLDELLVPEVPGRVRFADEHDVEFLGRWRHEFGIEAMGGVISPLTPEQEVRRGVEGGNGHAIWEVDGVPVSWAAASVPVRQMSRIGPVYTPPEHRAHGYAAAVTAAVTRWAQRAGAKDVLLYTDVTNPTSNSVYRRIGFVPVLEATELAFH
jgi:predicted GNAT family acetyltransferase